MEYRILGPLEVSADGRALDLGGSRQQRVLAALLLTPNRIVPLDRLVEMAWDGEPPATADRQVRNRVAALRAVLTRFGGFIDTQESGYLLRVGPGELDAERFDELVARGREARDPATLREALALWRGPALFDTEMGLRCRAAAVSLSERRSAAQEDLIAAQINCGRERLVVPELRQLVAQHPERERLSEQLMLALYRSGRQKEALEVFHAARRWLSNELGVEAGHALHSMHRAILNQDPALAQPVAS